MKLKNHKSKKIIIIKKIIKNNKKIKINNNYKCKKIKIKKINRKKVNIKKVNNIQTKI